MSTFADRFTGGGALPLDPFTTWMLGQRGLSESTPLPFLPSPRGLPLLADAGGAGPGLPVAPFAQRFGEFEPTTTRGGLPASKPAGMDLLSMERGTDGSFSLPPTAEPTQGAGVPPLPLGPPGSLPQQGGGGGGGFGDFLNNNWLTLLALGGGIAEGGIGRGLESAARTGVSQQLAQQRLFGSDDIKEYEYARRQGYQGSLADWMARKRAGAGEYGLNAIWGVGPDGKPAIVQLGKSGEAVSPKLPSGFEPSRGVEKVDLGDRWGFMDKQTGTILNVAPKNLAEKERQEAVGKKTGEAQFDLPLVEQNATQALATIEQIRNHPGKKYGIGVTGVLPGIPGTQQKDFVSLVDQAKGKAFLEAFQTLKGGGQITEIEGKKATDAIARLDRTQSPAGFDRALKDLEDVINVGLGRARKQAGQSGSAPPAPAAPSGGGTIKWERGPDGKPRRVQQ